jgi:hypothetical protein
MCRQNGDPDVVLNHINSLQRCCMPAMTIWHMCLTVSVLMMQADEAAAAAAPADAVQKPAVKAKKRQVCCVYHAVL